MLVRTNIYLPQETLRNLKQKATARGISMSEIVRQALNKHEKEVSYKQSAAASLLRLAKRATKGSGLGDVSINHDYYLANEPKD